MWAKCISKDGNQCDHLHSMNDSEVKKKTDRHYKFSRSLHDSRSFKSYLRVEEDLSTATLLEMLKVSTVSRDLTGKNKGLITNRKNKLVLFTYLEVHLKPYRLPNSIFPDLGKPYPTLNSFQLSRDL